MIITNLYKAKKNTIYQIVSAPDTGGLKSLGLKIGTRIEIRNRYIFGGPVLLKVEDVYYLALGKALAEHIQVMV